jgi:hypothetical protein
VRLRARLIGSVAISFVAPDELNAEKFPKNLEGVQTIQ